jgi:3-oxoacyl-[acyl-carrier protein] reductase
MPTLKDQVAIVTGASRGIGRSIALRFAAEGCRVVLVSRPGPALKEAAEEITRQGGSAMSVAADVSEPAGVNEIVGRTVATFGTVNILINNAAVIHDRINVVDFPVDEWERVIKVNLTGVFLMCRSVLPTMLKQRSGRIINIASIGGRRGAAGRTAYRASKAAVINFTESLAAEVYAHGIHVNGICPSAVKTEMYTSVFGSEHTMMPPEEIAELALFLASGKSAAITGTSIDAFGRANPLFA